MRVSTRERSLVADIGLAFLVAAAVAELDGDEADCARRSGARRHCAETSTGAGHPAAPPPPAACREGAGRSLLRYARARHRAAAPTRRRARRCRRRARRPPRARPNGARRCRGSMRRPRRPCAARAGPEASRGVAARCTAIAASASASSRAGSGRRIDDLRSGRRRLSAWACQPSTQDRSGLALLSLPRSRRRLAAARTRRAWRVAHRARAAPRAHRAPGGGSGRCGSPRP